MKILKKIILSILVTIACSIFLMTISQAATVKVTADTLNLRKKASTASGVLALISKGTECELIEEDGEWYKVKYKTYTGYISKDYAKKIEESSDKNIIDSEKEDNEAKQNTNEIIEEVSETTGKVSNKTDVKILPLINSSKIDSLNKNEKVIIISEINGWSYIQTDEVVGWMRSDVITDKKISTIEITTNKEETTNTTKNDDKTETIENTDNKDDKEEQVNNTSDDKKEENKNSETQKYEAKTVYVAESYVNLRKQPNTSSKVVMVVALNTKLNVVGESGDWYKLSTSSGEAYVLKTLVSDQKKSTTSRGGNLRTDETTNTNKTEATTVSKVENTTSKETTTKKDTETNTTSTSSSTTSSKGQEIVAYAKKFLGVPYVYGGASKSGFDCSGFTMYVYKKFGISIPHGAKSQSKLGKKISANKKSASSLKNNLQPGDLVFFLDYETMDEIGHCGIYIGDGKFIHASSGSGYCVKINSLLPGEYYNTRYCAARRLI